MNPDRFASNYDNAENISVFCFGVFRVVSANVLSICQTGFYFLFIVCFYTRTNKSVEIKAEPTAQKNPFLPLLSIEYEG